jgi:hypothetical protein
MAKLKLAASAAPAPDTADTPSDLGEHGQRLWREVRSEFTIDDIGGKMLLLQAAHALDMADRLSKQIADIEAVDTKESFLAARHELACRSFAVKCLKELGITTEPKALHGRPYKSYGFA